MNKLKDVIRCYFTGTGGLNYSERVALRGKDCADCLDFELCDNFCELLRKYKDATFWEKFIELWEKSESLGEEQSNKEGKK